MRRGQAALGGGLRTVLVRCCRPDTGGAEGQDAGQERHSVCHGGLPKSATQEHQPTTFEPSCPARCGRREVRINTLDRFATV